MIESTAIGFIFVSLMKQTLKIISCQTKTYSINSSQPLTNNSILYMWKFQVVCGWMEGKEESNNLIIIFMLWCFFFFKIKSNLHVNVGSKNIFVEFSSIIFSVVGWKWHIFKACILYSGEFSKLHFRNILFVVIFWASIHFICNNFRTKNDFTNYGFMKRDHWEIFIPFQSLLCTAAAMKHDKVTADYFYSFLYHHLFFSQIIQCFYYFVSSSGNYHVVKAYWLWKLWICESAVGIRIYAWLIKITCTLWSFNDAMTLI